jgi:hypothetical protein
MNFVELTRPKRKSGVWGTRGFVAGTELEKRLRLGQPSLWCRESKRKWTGAPGSPRHSQPLSSPFYT